MQEILKKSGKILIRYLLVNFIWLLPGLLFCIRHPALKIVYLSFLVSYTTMCVIKEYSKKPVLLVKMARGILFLYYLSVIVFLLLTSVATYEGIVNIFGLVSIFHKTFAVVFAVGISLALFVITLVIKERTSPKIILSALVIYMLFDSMTALPFNFLFFYDNLKRAAEVETDKKIIDVVINACDSVIAPRLRGATSNIKLVNNIIKLRDEASEYELERKLAAAKRKLDALWADTLITRADYENRKRKLYLNSSLKVNKITREEIERQNTYVNEAGVYKELNDSLYNCKLNKNTLNDIVNTDSATKLLYSIKRSLSNICNQSNDTALRSYAVSMYPRQPSSLEAIKQLYRMLGDYIAGNNNPEEHDTKNGKDTNMLMTMSLSSSIVIDILPLFLSLLYARFKRED